MNRRATRALVLAALVVWPMARTAADQSEPATDNALATLCSIVEGAAKAEGLPVDFFTRLIWRESAFRPDAVSPAGAQGVAQFMPGTAFERGLDDPFDPATAIPASAKLLAEFAQRFGNLGLAAAAYNAGPNALANWLAGRGAMPFETQDYVLAVTDRSIEDWRSASPQPVQRPQPESCLTLIAKLRVPSPSSSHAVEISGLFAPWGVQVAGSFSKAAALNGFARDERRYASVIADMKPFILGSRLMSRGFRPFYRVRLPAQTRGEAEKLCARLEAAGGACVVLRS